MKLIPLTQGQFAIVDDADYEYLMQWKWYANKIKGHFYAFRGYRLIGGGRKGKVFRVAMHRVVTHASSHRTHVVDHINHNTLDNRKENLRVCTNKENLKNWDRSKRDFTSIPNEAIEIINSSRSRGDLSNISKICQVGINNVRNTIQRGEGRKIVVDSIINYYLNKTIAA